jgi:hypothetical protein
LESTRRSDEEKVDQLVARLQELVIEERKKPEAEKGQVKELKALIRETQRGNEESHERLAAALQAQFDSYPLDEDLVGQTAQLLRAKGRKRLVG